MNWYKVAQSKGIEGAISKMREDPRFPAKTLDWIQSLNDTVVAGRAIAMVRSNPTIDLDKMRETLDKMLKVEPLTEKETMFLGNYPKFKDWLSRILMLSTGKRREEVFDTIRREIGMIADWYGSGEDRPKLNSDLSLNEAIRKTREWHQSKADMSAEDYEPIKPENIVKKYSNGWFWVKLTTKRDLAVEGKKLKICIGEECSGYIPEIVKGRANAYSLRGSENNPYVTAYLTHGNTLLQEVKKENNADPTEKYLEYIKDLFGILGVKYSKEYYLEPHQEKLGVKNWNYITEDDFLNDPFLQKIAHNAIVRGDFENIPGFAKNWVNDTLESDKVPHGWVDAIGKMIGEKGYPPSFARKWAKSILDSGKAPQEWIDGINKNIVSDGVSPDFAHDWAKNILESGKAPQEWIDGINEHIKKRGYAPDFARDWIKNILESGKAPQWLIDAINIRIKEKRSPPDFAYRWAKKTLESGKAPQEWIDAINDYIEQRGYPPQFAETWYNIR